VGVRARCLADHDAVATDCSRSNTAEPPGAVLRVRPRRTDTTWSDGSESTSLGAARAACAGARYAGTPGVLSGGGAEGGVRVFDADEARLAPALCGDARTLAAAATSPALARLCSSAGRLRASRMRASSSDVEMMRCVPMAAATAACACAWAAEPGGCASARRTPRGLAMRRPACSNDDGTGIGSASSCSSASASFSSGGAKRRALFCVGRAYVATGTTGRASTPADDVERADVVDVGRRTLFGLVVRRALAAAPPVGDAPGSAAFVTSMPPPRARGPALRDAPAYVNARSLCIAACALGVRGVEAAAAAAAAAVAAVPPAAPPLRRMSAAGLTSCMAVLIPVTVLAIVLVRRAVRGLCAARGVAGVPAPAPAAAPGLGVRRRAAPTELERAVSGGASSSPSSSMCTPVASASAVLSAVPSPAVSMRLLGGGGAITLPPGGCCCCCCWSECVAAYAAVVELPASRGSGEVAPAAAADDDVVVMLSVLPGARRIVRGDVGPERITTVE
jgi:hypothetical protein